MQKRIASRHNLTGTETVLCPRCYRATRQWAGEKEYGIECTECGHSESFRRNAVSESS